MGPMGDALELLTGAILPFIILLSIIILTHEAGHYLAARLYRLPVSRFSLGFGPRLFGWHDRHGTEWTVAAIPLGGFVRVSFDRRLAARAWVIAAGPLANIALAAGLLFVHALIGIRDAPPVVAAVYPNSPAAAAGLQPGDHLISLNGRGITGFSDVHRYTALHYDVPVTLRYLRQGAERSATIRPLIATLTLGNGRVETVGLTGLVGGPVETLRPHLAAAALGAVTGTGALMADTVYGLHQLATGARSYTSMMGVVGITDTAGIVVEASGIAALLTFAALVSVNVGIVNALPLPVLDGGQLLMTGVEALLRRPLPSQVQRYGNLLGLGLLTVLLLLTTWNDLRLLL